MTRSPVLIYLLICEDEFSEVLEHLKSNSYFGVKGVICLPQENLPVLDNSGKVFLEDVRSIATRPIGSGGFFRCLIRDGTLDQ